MRLLLDAKDIHGFDNLVNVEYTLHIWNCWIDWHPSLLQDVNCIFRISCQFIMYIDYNWKN